MADDPQPVIVAFDGSPPAQAAVRTAAKLFADRRLLVVSVWEPGLAMAGMAYPDATGVTYPTPTRQEIDVVDRAEEGHARAIAEAGARIAREAGATAEAVPIPDTLDVAETMAGVAQQRGAALVVVGSRGRTGVKARLLGSTSRRLLHDCELPVLVVRAQA